MAALRLVLAIALLLVLAPAAARAGEPSAPPAPRPPTCAERFPEEGPAGVDLRLGCIVSEIVGLYSAGQATTPPTLSTYGLALIGSVLALALLAVALARLLARRTGDALAPVMPDAWWQCPRCRSINGAGATRCYSCSTPRPSDPAVTLTTEDVPSTSQSFGRGKRG